MKLTIETSTQEQFDSWSKFNSPSIEVILIAKNQRALYEVYINYVMQCVPYNFKQYGGRGFYLIKEIWQSTDEASGIISLHGLALYKHKSSEPFKSEAEVLLYLNPLHHTNSIGRKDFALENLVGATIEIIKPYVIHTYKRKKGYSSFCYKWTINDYPDEQDNTYQPIVADVPMFDLSEEELAAMGY